VRVVDARPSEGVNMRFYRARIGTTLALKFSFIQIARSTASWDISPTFPIPILGYRGVLEVDNDTEYSAPASVFFTGPPGSGITNSPGDPAGTIVGTDLAMYQTMLIPSAVKKGIWNVNYKGTNVSFDVPDPETGSRFVVPVPTFRHEPMGATLVSWAYADPDSGAYLPRAPIFMNQIQLLVPDKGYQSANLPPSTTNQHLPFPLDTRSDWTKTVFT